MCMRAPSHIYNPPYLTASRIHPDNNQHNNTSTTSADNNTNSNESFHTYANSYNMSSQSPIMDEKLLLKQRDEAEQHANVNKELPMPVSYNSKQKKTLANSKCAIVGYSTIIMAVLFFLIGSFHDCSMMMGGPMPPRPHHHPDPHHQQNPGPHHQPGPRFNGTDYGVPPPPPPPPPPPHHEKMKGKGKGKGKKNCHDKGAAEVIAPPHNKGDVKNMAHGMNEGGDNKKEIKITTTIERHSFSVDHYDLNTLLIEEFMLLD